MDDDMVNGVGGWCNDDGIFVSCASDEADLLDVSEDDSDDDSDSGNYSDGIGEAPRAVSSNDDNTNDSDVGRGK
jgi:hypothetical protein